MLNLLNYDEVMSRTNNIEHDLESLINKDDEEEKGPNKLSLSRYEDDDDNSINPIKNFNTKTSRIFADSENEKLNLSMTSQKSLDPFTMTNSSLISTYLYKAGSTNCEHSPLGSQVHSPSKRSSATSNNNKMEYSVII